MLMHPQPPTELDQLIEAYVQSGQAVTDLGITCTPADFDKPTQCPGWSVQDQFAHMASLEHSLLGHQDPTVELPDYPWLRNDLGRHMELGIEVRRSWPGAQVVTEWQQVFAVRQAQLREPGLTPDQEVEGPFGPTALGDLLALRVVDLWVHEQDLREALGRPGNLDTPGAALFTSRILQAFPGRVAKRAGLADGTTVIIESTGPVQARAGIHLSTVNGRQHADELFSGEDRVDEATGEVAPIRADRITTIKLSTEALTRRGAGRIGTADLRRTVIGDEQVAAQVLDVLPITP